MTIKITTNVAKYIRQMECYKKLIEKFKEETQIKLDIWMWGKAYLVDGKRIEPSRVYEVRK
mgnify:FL=1